MHNSGFTYKKLVTVIVILLGFTCAASAKDVTDAWNGVLKKCAKNQSMGKNGIFFGPSNSVGPGSVWRKSDDGGYGLRFELADAVADEATRNNLFVRDNIADCSGNTSSNWDIKAGLPFESQLKPLSGDISIGFHHAKKITVKANSFGWQLVKELPYEQAFKALSNDNPYKQDIGQPNRWVLSKALLVSGFTAELDFDSSVGVSLKSKLPPGDLKTTDNTTFGLNWQGDTHLTITSKDSFFIWGEKSKMVGDSFGLAGGPPSDYKMTPDKGRVEHPEIIHDLRGK